jgi:hypothetical protein
MRFAWLLAAGFGALLAHSPAPAALAEAPPSQSEADEYTRYELLAPETSQFRIRYEVTATTPGATVFYNPIRKGSEVSNEAVYDRLSAAPLTFDIVDGPKAKAEGYLEAEPDTSYIKIHLPRPVPKAGEVRLLIDKTYKDPKSYLREGDRIVFSRSLSIRRNAVVLPADYELVACNVPSQILRLDDGRIQVSFMNPLPAEAPLVVKARRLP